MPIVPNHRTASWSAGLLSLLLLPGSLWGQQTPASHEDGFATAIATESDAPEPLNQIGFVPNWKLILPLVADGDEENDPRKRFFVSFEQMLFRTSPASAAGAIEPKSPHAALQIMPASFSVTALENLAASAISSLVPNLGSGGRLEFGRMETDNTGWSVSILELNNSGPNAQSPDGSRTARPK